MLNDPLADLLSNILNASKSGKTNCISKPSSKLIENILSIMQNHKYIDSYELIENGKGKIIKVNLIGRINKCGAIKPRFSIKKENYEKFEKRFLPAKDFGIMIISTSKGLMTHYEAKEKNMGGKLIAYIY